MGGSASEAAVRPAPSLQARLELAQSRLGQTLAGRWTLKSVLGIGGSATVYEACHRNGRRAALKVLHSELAASPTLVQRFMSEGYAANKVHHAGAVLALDDGEHDGLVFLVLELLDGRSLAERLAESGPLPLDDVIRISVDVLDVLAAAHERGVIHRDVKPGNIFELAHGGIKVLDFGVAHVREPGTQAITQSGFTLGTPAFMAPEQAAGRIDIDALTDIWAVGATMFQLLTGRLVHDAATPNAALLAAATVPVRPIRALKPELPEDVAAIIDRALAFERKERWPNASAMRLALARARPQATGRTSETPLWLGPETLPPAPAESARRQRRRAIWIATAVLLGFGALFGLLLLRGKRSSTVPKGATTAMPAAPTSPRASLESPRPHAEPALQQRTAAPAAPSARPRPPAPPQKARPQVDDELLLDRRK